MNRPLTNIERAKITRLRVFGFVKRYMEARGECPTAPEVAANLDLALSTANRHLLALDGAAGLPLPTRTAYRSIRREPSAREEQDVLTYFDESVGADLSKENWS